MDLSEKTKAAWRAAQEARAAAGLVAGQCSVCYAMPGDACIPECDDEESELTPHEIGLLAVHRAIDRGRP